MPTAPRSRCSTYGCAEFNPCPVHRKPWVNPSANNRTLTRNERQRFHDQVIKAHPYCWCGAPATEADHVIPVSEGGAHTDPANGAGLCHQHHAEKTIEDQRRATARRTQQASEQ